MLSSDVERVVYGSISWDTNLQTYTILIGPCTTCHGLSRRTCVTVCYKSQPGVRPLSLVTILTLPSCNVWMWLHWCKLSLKYKMKIITGVLELFPPYMGANKQTPIVWWWIRVVNRRLYFIKSWRCGGLSTIICWWGPPQDTSKPLLRIA